MSTNKETPMEYCNTVKKGKLDIITPHRLAIAILIKNFHKYRETDEYKNEADGMFSKYLRDFCVLLLKLMQSPDIELAELWSLLTSENYNLPEALKLLFKQDLNEINNNGVGSLLDVIDGLSRLMADNESDPIHLANKCIISKNSVVGYYLRRLIVNFDKLTFSEVTEIYSSFQRYCRDLISFTFMPEENHLFHMENWSGGKNLWTRRQAELFIATQAALLESNEEKAMRPKDLQNIISNILKTNPNLAEAHFLAYLNYLRVKEFCGAIDSLYHCFDLNNIGEMKNGNDDKPKIYRFAALNLAVLHHHFDHHEEALASLREAIRIAQDANDSVCLQHALSWLYRLIVTNKDKLIEHSVLKSFGLNLSYRTSLGIQTFVQLSSLLSAKPHHIFETLAKSDIINYQHNHRDLISNSYAVKSSLWQFYGKPEMSSLWSQLLLYLNIDNPKPSKAYYGEAFCLSICNVAMHLLAQGKYNLVYCILSFAKLRFPNEPNSHIWMLCDCIFYFIRALYHEDWNEAEAAAQRLTIVDKWESYLRLAELYLYKQDYVEANKYVDMVFERYEDEDKSKFKGYQYIRAKLLLAEIQFASNIPHSIPSGIMDLLSNCLIETNKYQLDYYTAMIYMHMANVQLHLGMTGQALMVLDKCMIQIMSHGGCYDRARCLLLYVKCLIADSTRLKSQEKNEVMKKGTVMLNEVKELFSNVEAYSRMKDVLYLQAKLYNNLNMRQDRNRCALEFRLLEEEYATKNTQTLVKYL
ncbi:hypothetical protein WA026_018860 [Henosepilachna vigintioctopunctata]|uniref:Anaphase-promoting complex subunit 5 n=1 Tax=Henosepilachna vigintioctopunctata TaxID=420089 RepID=A0AAW1UNE7_9CUCU